IASPIPTVDIVIDKVDRSQIEKISPLEWVFCLRKKAKWDQNNPRAQETSEKFWQIALHHALLRQHLIKSLALHYSDRKAYDLAASLVRAFPVFANEAQVKHLLVVQVLQALDGADALMPSSNSSVTMT
ncbi:MAG: hypothetical protein HC772_10610, partial [Leptolyngbyaceae cyanobacterium CRU_2_3]|nr:hypothetical protein [Leptolyngbyaceae cyanobacterium CRU_2_3]